MRLWQNVLNLGDKIIILEHDALFTRQFIENDIDKSHKWRGEVVGLNDPRGMTRKSQVYHDLVSKQEGIQDVPYVDESKDAMGSCR